MKPRARRGTIAAAVLGAAVVAVLVVVHWDSVRDHVEAWHFQLTKETEAISAVNGLMGSRGQSPQKAQYAINVKELLGVLAEDSGCPVIVESKSAFALALPAIMPPDAKGSEAALTALRANGWRIVEQRFPRRAYVLSWVCPPTMQAALQKE
jgi:hypothetical protein